VPSQILVIEDDTLLNELTCTYLREVGYATKGVRS
jgi:hypothetical protein